MLFDDISRIPDLYTGNVAVRSELWDQVRINARPVCRQVKLLVPLYHLVTPGGVEVYSVLRDEHLGAVIVAFGLDAHQLRE